MKRQVMGVTLLAGLVLPLAACSDSGPSDMAQMTAAPTMSSTAAASNTSSAEPAETMLADCEPSSADLHLTETEVQVDADGDKTIIWRLNAPMRVYQSVSVNLFGPGPNDSGMGNTASVDFELGDVDGVQVSNMREEDMFDRFPRVSVTAVDFSRPYIDIVLNLTADELIDLHTPWIATITDSNRDEINTCTFGKV